MNKQTQFIYGAGLLTCVLAFSFWSCSQEQSTTSTEVENEFKVAYIQGIAATGYALSNAPWEIFTADGSRLTQGVTNSEGEFFASLDTEVLISRPWLVRIIEDDDTLTALFGFSESETVTDTLFGLVNPMTDYVARRVLGPAALSPLGGYRSPYLDSLDLLGQTLVEDIFGKGVNWIEFSRDTSYRPAMDNADSGYYPSANDLLLHSLKQDAENQNMTRRDLMDSFHESTSSCALKEKSFRLDVASNMVLFNVPEDIATNQLKNWETAQGIDSGDGVESQYLEMLEYHSNSNSENDSTAQEATQLGWKEASSAIQTVISTYYGSAQEVALDNYTEATKIIADLLNPYTTISALSDDPSEVVVAPSGRVRTLANNIGYTLASLNPSYWSSEEEATRLLTKTVLNNCLLLDDEGAPADLEAAEIRALVDSTWAGISDPAFSEDPRRSDSWETGATPGDNSIEKTSCLEDGT
ncbi:MAG TPA: hypothetical protein VLM37_03655 [Fibrobacteraceae bacterium]|nr:hypothetical protein [Fibrobacteraceae bacterium]